MRTIQVLSLFVLALGFFSVTADAQKRKTPVRRTTAKKPPATRTAVAKPAVTATMIVTKTKVANQLSNVNQFINVLGPIAQGIETTDNDVKARRNVSRSLTDQNEENKRKVIQAIRNLKSGLVTLETDFRTKPDLKKYLINIQGISDLTAQSEDAAIAGKFVSAKDPLRTVAKRLSDTLAVMP